ncbi:hypothetical protein Q9L58_009357 [Maublancomyces gigas]|uniref:Uncharacterized protein n=1 Tax=Discina gigas TaxID=1032678 RepID=A0ABR3G7V8_9PEZI
MAAAVTIEDVNTIVAIATSRIGFTEIPGATARVDKLLLAGVPWEYNRFIAVLDAIASLAVCDREKQVIAVGLRNDLEEFQLLFAENGVVNPKVITHIGELWKMLAAYRTLPVEGRAQKQLQIVKSVYVHSYPKLIRRFTKRRWLVDMEVAFDGEVRTLPGTVTLVRGALDVISSLVTVRELLDKLAIWRPTVTKNKPDGNSKLFPTDAEWRKLIIEMDEATADLELVMKNESTCKEWARALEGISGLPAEPVDLFRAIQKLSSHHRHINHLLRYADTLEAHDDFVKARRLIALPVDPLRQSVMIPDNSEPGQVLQNIIMPFLPLGVDYDNEVAAVGTAVGTLPRTSDGIVHCECSLVARFHRDPPQRQPPINYIGVSKLSCAGCYSWLQAYNDTYDLKYHTQGTHGRWYPNWAIPSTVQDPKFLARIREVVGQSYKSFLAAGAGHVSRIGPSDSSDAEDIIPGRRGPVPVPIDRNVIRTSASSRSRRLAARRNRLAAGDAGGPG